MAGRLLFDTSAIIDSFRSEAEADRLLASEGEAFISVIVIGELLAGALRS